jgi:hypothetical protein
MELLPVAKHLVNGPHMIEYFALVAAWMGEKELACEHMEKATGLSGSGLLTQYDSLRGDPRASRKSSLRYRSTSGGIVWSRTIS